MGVVAKRRRERIENDEGWQNWKGGNARLIVRTKDLVGWTWKEETNPNQGLEFLIHSFVKGDRSPSVYLQQSSAKGTFQVTWLSITSE